jgi:hypothetical protein
MALVSQEPLLQEEICHGTLPHQGFLASRKPSYAKYAKMTSATPFTHNGTCHAPSDNDHLNTSRDKWPSAMSKKTALAIRVNVL